MPLYIPTHAWNRGMSAFVICDDYDQTLRRALGD